MQLARSETTTDGSNFDQFIGLLDRYVAFLERAGKRVFRSPPAEAQELFLGLGHERGVWLLDRLRNELAALEEVVEAGESLNNSSRLLWRFLQRGKIKPASDFFDKITQADIIEVFASNHVHIWQSLNYFDYISATIERIYTERWYEILVRDLECERALGQLAAGIITGDIAGTIAPNVGWHWIQEVSTARLYKMELLVRHLSPITMDGKIIGLIAICAARNLHSLVDQPLPLPN